MVGLFVFLTVVLINAVFYIENNNNLIEKKLEILEQHLKGHGMFLSSRLQATREDTLFLAATPPVDGIIRATSSKEGIDPLDGSSEKQWRERLAIIFQEMLSAKQAYLQMRFIGQKKELVRVQKLNDHSYVVPEKDLQNKYESAYISETEKLKEREIYMSDIGLNREFGTLTVPHLPVIRMSTPVYDSQGKIFGIVVINIDFMFLLNDIASVSELRNGMGVGVTEFYVTSDKGDFLVTPDVEKIFGFEFGKRFLIQDLYPVYRELIETKNAQKTSTPSNGSPVIFKANGIDKVAYYHKSYFDPIVKKRFLGMAMVVNYDDVVGGSYAIRSKSILLMMVLVAVAMICALFFARTITDNLMRITDAAKKFVNGEHEFDLPIEGQDEVGALARTLENMINQVGLRDEALRESGMRFSGIIELAREGIISLDEKQNIILFNRGAEKIFGYNKEEILGKQLEILLPKAVREQHQSQIQEFSVSKEFSRIMQNKKNLYGLTKSGKQFPMEASISKLSVNNKMLFTVVVRDITSQVNSKEALLTIQQNLSDAQQIASMGSFIWVIDTGAMEWSDELYRILDYEIGVHIPTLNKITMRVHPDDQAYYDEYLEKVFGLTRSVDLRFRAILPNGNTRSMIMSFRLRDCDKSYTSKVAGTIQDVTDQIKTVEEKQALSKQLQQSQKMDAIGQLTGGIAHDFNNILASIMGYTNLAQESFAQDNPKLAEYLDEVYHAGERARDLIAHMLTFSRGGNGEPTILDAQPLIIDVIKMLKSTIPSSIEVTTDFAKELPKIMMDPVQLHQLVMNLCINSRDAMHGHGKLDIKLHDVKFAMGELNCCACQNEVHGRFLELQVIDTGDGINPSDINRIFDPFFSTKDVGKGTGMGLSMVHGIVHENGGHIKIKSKPGEGAIFKLYLPVAEQAEHKEETYVSVAEKTIEQLNIIENTLAHILIVDDESAVASYLKELFETRGYKVTVENDSVKALNLFQNNPEIFDIVITDQTMPKLTGAELSKEILSLRSDIPIVLCTGYSDVIDESQAFEIGINEYLTKPIDSVRLCNAVTRLSRHAQSLVDEAI